MSTLELLIKAWPIILFVVITLIGLGKALYQLKEHQALLSEIKRTSKERLFAHGESIYMPRTTCTDARRRITDSVEDKIDELRGQYKAMAAELRQIVHFMGRVEEYMKAADRPGRNKTDG